MQLRAKARCPPIGAAMRIQTKAASALLLSQPSLTVQIRQLEQGLGARVLDRNTRSTNLTAVDTRM
jgi:DNA-binding transcriptional LysR family regulator